MDKNMFRPMPWDRGGNVDHGSLRGADTLHPSPQFEGRFGRIFRTLPAAKLDPDDLRKLAFDGITAKPEVVKDDSGDSKRDKDNHLIPKATSENEIDDEENFGIPAGYTYLGQFIDHDITFDPVSSLQRQNDPDALIDYRTPRLDLDCIYGRGPADQPYMYDRDGLHFALGRDLKYGDSESPVTDLPRFNGRALIGDKRNDENVIVSQLHGVFLRFHNAVANKLNEKASTFEDVQRIVRWHYQWVVLHDFLPRIVGWEIIHEILPHLNKNKKDGNIYKDKPQLCFFKWKNEPFMPIEFAAAAYRFGHSMVRPIYRLNTQLGADASEDEKERGIAGRQFIFAAVQKEGLNGFREFNVKWAIDWKLFFELGKKLNASEKQGVGRVQPAYKIDSSLVNPLAFLPEFSERVEPEGDLKMDRDGHPKAREGEISNLAYRNLLRGESMALPSGQSVARYMGLVPLKDDDLKVGKANVEGLTENKSIAEYGASFSDNAPLWFYILAEAQYGWAQQAKDSKGSEEDKNILPVQLGPVGARIVAEVLIGLLLGDRHSFLSQSPNWRPSDRDWLNKEEEFGMPELIKASGLG